MLKGWKVLWIVFKFHVDYIPDYLSGSFNFHRMGDIEGETCHLMDYARIGNSYLILRRAQSLFVFPLGRILDGIATTESFFLLRGGGHFYEHLRIKLISPSEDRHLGNPVRKEWNKAPKGKRNMTLANCDLVSSPHWGEREILVIMDIKRLLLNLTFYFFKGCFAELSCLFDGRFAVGKMFIRSWVTKKSSLPHVENLWLMKEVDLVT